MSVRHFYRLAKLANVRRIRFHAVQLTSASLQLLNGERIRVVVERIGHANPAITISHFCERNRTNDHESDPQPETERGIW